MIELIKLSLQELKEMQAAVDAIIMCRAGDEIPAPDYMDGTEDLKNYLNNPEGKPGDVMIIDSTQPKGYRWGSVDGIENHKKKCEDGMIGADVPVQVIVSKPKRSRKTKLAGPGEVVSQTDVVAEESDLLPLIDEEFVDPVFPPKAILSTDLVNFMIDSEQSGKITQLELLQIVRSVGLEAVKDVCLTTPDNIAAVWAAVEAKVKGNG
jgi:hypothetical protein